ncbi:hypothetical protein [Bacteroides sp. 519]|uniref:hypothetical protein n=1 Tax=Bacteroides sp. 519 TaxID=2302937 RepID=UPI0013D51B08|nr:hypothetical protein [Bacteroides sp. 519]NDV57892.1 hypothetical protein [Bacteroides sp. 519]
MATNSNRTKKIIIRIGIGILATFLVLLIIIGIVLNTIVTPKRITPVLLEVAHQYLDAEINCESIDITFFSTFPDLGIQMNNGSIVHSVSTDSIHQPSAPDTLLVFEKGTVSLNPVAFIFNRKIVLHKFEVQNGDVYAFVNADGKANWDIVIPSEEVAQQPEENKAFDMPELNIKDIHLQDIRITYDDLHEDVFVLMDSVQMKLNGNMAKDRANLNLAFRTSGITSYYQGQTYSKELPVSIRTKLNNDRINKSLTLDRGAINLGILKLRTAGSIVRDSVVRGANVNIDFTLNASSLSDIVEMVPAHINDINSQIVANGEIQSTGKISGLLSREQYPTLSLSFQLANGMVAPKKHKDKPFAEEIKLNFETLIDFSGKQSSTFKLNEFSANSGSSKIHVKGSLNNLLTQPFVDTQAKAIIDFTQLSQSYSFLEDIKMGGMIDFDLSAKSLLSDIQSFNLGKININGNANIKSLFFNHLKENFSLYATNADMKFGSNTRDSIRGRLLESLLRGSVSMDSLNLNWKDEIKASAGKVSSSFSTSEPKDSSSIAPVTTTARVRNLQLNMGDSVRLRSFRTNAFARIAPSKGNLSLPEISLRFALDTVGARYTDTGGSIRNANLSLKLNKLQTQNNRRANTTTDTTNISSNRQRYAGMTREQRDSLRKVHFNPEANLSFRLESQETRDLLRNWDVTGDLKCTSVRLRTPLFPLPIRVMESQMNFTTNNLKIEKADLQIGSSALSLSGDIDGIRQALLFNGKVAAKLTLTGDSIDFNQLIKAAVAGSEYSSKSSIEKDSISATVLDESKAIPINVDTVQSAIFVVPRNLDIEFNSRIQNAKFSDIHIRNAMGRIILRDQAIQLPRFSLSSDIGKATMTMVYKAANSEGAHVGMDVNITQMDIKELIQAVPMIDELAPMLRSFEGVVDCEMTAVTELDSVMNVLLPRTTASCYLHGKDMVLLDGETFSEISKTLMFKNKKRNVIDSISVEMIMEDEKLMIFPFQVSIDRYSAGVGGLQNLDLSFNYHITVLKSPLPFKLGLNITGNADDMKIRLAKAKYKDLFTVAREKQLTETINVREEMGQKLRKSINEIVGSDLKQPIRRPKSSLPDSLRNEYFRMDTTKVAFPTGHPGRTKALSYRDEKGSINYNIKLIVRFCSPCFIGSSW